MYPPQVSNRPRPPAGRSCKSIKSPLQYRRKSDGSDTGWSEADQRRLAVVNVPDSDGSARVAGPIYSDLSERRTGDKVTLKFECTSRNTSTKGTNQRPLYNRHYPKVAQPSPVAPTYYPIVKDDEWLPPPSSPASRWSRFRAHFHMSRHSGKKLRKPGTEEEWDRKDIGSITRSSTKSAKYSATDALKSLARIPTRMSSRVEWTKRYKPPPGAQDDSRDVLDFGSGSRKSGSRLRSFLSRHNPFKSTPKIREANMKPKEFFGPFSPKIPVTPRTNARSENSPVTSEEAASVVPSWKARSQVSTDQLIPSALQSGYSYQGIAPHSLDVPISGLPHQSIPASHGDVGRPLSVAEQISPWVDSRTSPSLAGVSSIHCSPVSRHASTASARSSFRFDRRRQSTGASSRESQTPASSIDTGPPDELSTRSRVAAPVGSPISSHVTRDMSYVTYNRHLGARKIHIPPKRKPVGSAATKSLGEDAKEKTPSGSTAARSRSGTGDSGYVSQKPTRKSTAPSLPELSFQHDSTWPPLRLEGIAV